MKKIILVFSLMLTTNSLLIAQEKFIDEYELALGYSIFQGDFGESGEFPTTYGNSGILLNAKAYFNLFDYNKPNCYTCRHIKFPFGFTAGYSNLNFDEAYKDIEQPTLNLIKLKAISGSVLYTSVSMGMEYHIGDLYKYAFETENFLQNFDPFIGGSIGVGAYKVDLESSLGDINDPNNLPEAFREGIYNQFGIVPMASFIGGMRVKLKSTLSLTLNTNWIYFFSDKVDGLVPKPSLVSNDHDDWLFSTSIGVVFLLRNKDGASKE